MMDRRRAVTLVEVLVVIAIAAVLLGLLMVAVQKVRQSGLRVKDKNNIRQIVLGLHQYGAVKEGDLPGWGKPSIVPAAGRDIGLTDSSPLYNVLPFLEPEVPSPYAEFRMFLGTYRHVIKAFLSPTDPTVGFVEQWRYVSGPSSYAVNQQVFLRPPRLGSFLDGTSGTIAVAQHYFLCNDRRNAFSYLYWAGSEPANNYDLTGDHSGTFADAAFRDVVPVTQGNPPTSRASRPGATFQVAPRLETADGRMLQATQPAGLLAGMFDGSVRTFAPSVPESVFWAAVTPAGQEIAGE